MTMEDRAGEGMMKRAAAALNIQARKRIDREREAEKRAIMKERSGEVARTDKPILCIKVRCCKMSFHALADFHNFSFGFSQSDHRQTRPRAPPRVLEKIMLRVENREILAETGMGG